MKKVLALLLCLSLVLSLGCAFAEEETKTLTILLEPSPYVIDYETNLLTKMIEEKFNVNLDFVYLPTTNAGDKLALMINSGETLPDIVNFKLSKGEATDYAVNGAFLPLNDYIEDISVNMKRYDEMYPGYGILSSITSYDGNIYTIPSYSDNHISNELRYKCWINQDWLDALGLEMPTTTDEFYDVLVAFKNDDPNGNGIADEIPLVGAVSAWSGDPTYFLMNSFGFMTTGNHLFADNGEVKASYTQDFYREGLEYIDKLIEEGLLDSASYTMDANAFKSLLNNQGEVIVGAFTYTTLDNLTEEDRLLSYRAVPPLTSPEGYMGASLVLAEPKPYWFVTKDCSDPELAFLIGDYLFDEDMYYAERMGVEGVNYEYTDETMVGAYEAFGFPSKIYSTYDIWTENQNTHWRCSQPCLAITVQYMGNYYTEEECAADIQKAVQNLTADGIGVYQTNRADGSYLVGSLAFTAEENDAIGTISADLSTFVNEQMVLFATGKRSLETWDEYLAQLEEIGLTKYLDVAQTAYDRQH